MLTPNFNPRPNVFSEQEEAFIKELVSKVSDACLSRRDCNKCIFSNFCGHTVYDGCRAAPYEILIDFFTILGVDF
jgi:hypothetical protein